MTDTVSGTPVSELGKSWVISRNCRLSPWPWGDVCSLLRKSLRFEVMPDNLQAARWRCWELGCRMRPLFCDNRPGFLGKRYGWGINQIPLPWQKLLSTFAPNCSLQHNSIITLNHSIQSFSSTKLYTRSVINYNIVHSKSFTKKCEIVFYIILLFNPKIPLACSWNNTVGTQCLHELILM